ncbi:MAG TPA: DUF4212 domain-containing protein [Burkholderiaceae bacterium]|jgi:putative solute:sodium symporter small subunit|nr:DUF4212 domain-containing protein [Burkholderiaceae bacterium]
MATDSSLTAQQRSVIYWQHVRRFTLQLLLVWFLVTFAAIFFARELSRFSILGWPFSFYMAAQGMLVIYALIVALYAWRMREFDKMIKNDADDEN